MKKFKALFVRTKRLARSKTVRTALRIVLRAVLRMALKELLDAAFGDTTADLKDRSKRDLEHLLHQPRSLCYASC